MNEDDNDDYYYKKPLFVVVLSGYKFILAPVISGSTEEEVRVCDLEMICHQQLY